MNQLREIFVTATGGVNVHRVRLAIRFFLIFLIPVTQVAAQNFPSRPITLTFPFTTGSPVELAFRVIGGEASKTLGQPIVYEARPGANGRLGVQGLKQAAPDGHHLTVLLDSLVVSQPILDPAFQFEPGKDYAPVALMIEFPLILVVNPSLPFKDVKGLIAYGKANPGKLNFGGTNGSSSYFLAERFRQAAGLQATLVPYKGSPQSMIDLMSGQIQGVFGAPTVESFTKAGKLAALATSGSQRWPNFPAVPTLLESGVPVATTAWYGIAAPAGTPADVVAKLNGAIFGALKHPDVLKQLDTAGMAPIKPMSGAEFAAFVQSESKAWAPVLRSSNIRMD
jgi:tripartite-type tricarboxylate transporter receptor subunit TctC